MKGLICERCGGSINPKSLKCEYCGTAYTNDGITIQVERVDVPYFCKEIRCKVEIPERRNASHSETKEQAKKEMIQKIAEYIAEHVEMVESYSLRNIAYVYTMRLLIADKERG